MELEEEKQLARRLALLLGLDGMKNREAVVLIHKEGLQMALGQGRERVKLLFMLAEFSVKLIEQDRRVVVKFLDSLLGKCRVKEWEVEEVAMYRNSLQGEQKDLAVGWE